MRKDTRKAHIVPCLYLKRFTHNGKQLFVFDKYQKNTYPGNIKDVAQARDFYKLNAESFDLSLIEGDFDNHIVEKTLSSIEANFNQTIDSILEHAQRKGITPEEKESMCGHLAIQWMRTNLFRKRLIDGYVKLVQYFADEQISKNFPSLPTELYPKAKYEASGHSAAHGTAIFHSIANDLPSILNSHIWLVGINQSSHPFYTSDNPVVMFTHKNHEPFAFKGVASKGIEIAFPLSPDCILILYERSYWKLFTSFELQPIPINSQMVDYYNKLQVCQSERQVYCSSHSFALAERICMKHPEVCVNRCDTTEVKFIGENYMGMVAERPGANYKWILEPDLDEQL